jgi:hypothetical protein
MDILAASGWMMTAVGLAVAAVQTYRVKSLARRNREQLEMFITDADYVSFEHEMLDELAPKLNDPMMHRFLVSSHQRGCDLYRGLVDYYLSTQREFTFEDVRRVCQTHMVSYRWQEEFWTDRVAMRPENRGKERPSEPLLAENRARRYRALKSRTQQILPSPDTLLPPEGGVG